MTFVKTAAISLFIVSMFYGQAVAAEAEQQCDNPGVLNTNYWKVFASMVKEEYHTNYHNNDDYHEDVVQHTKDVASFYGHALGRLAKAVNNQPERRKIYDCVELGVYQNIVFAAHYSPQGISESVRLFEVIKEASIGGLDRHIAQASGVSSVEPYHEYFKTILPQVPIRGTSTTPPIVGSGTMIKADPADMLGGGRSTPPSSLPGTCDNWMTITMNKDTEKACQEYVDDGYERRQSTTQCIVCNPDDWHPMHQTVNEKTTGSKYEQASVNGKYSGLLQEVHCQRDIDWAMGSYDFKDDEYYKAEKYCGQTVTPGYWVWVRPTWYIWAKKTQ